VTSTNPIAIIGGGPAGSLAAANLARAGRKVFLFDEKLAWEKPCGGGITHKALVEWPFLRDADVERNWIDQCELIGPSGRRVSFHLEQPIAIFSRQVLNGLLLQRAREAGVEIVHDRITRIDGVADDWKLVSKANSYPASFVIMATGARNTFRKQFSEPFAAEDMLVAAGYYIPGKSAVAQIQFLRGLQGYIWVFPRVDHFSAGICGKLPGKSTADLRRLLEDKLPALGLSFAGAKFYAHVLPSLRPETLRNAAVNGAGWAMIGDAAGFVDPITGEGLYYAMRSAELLSQALFADRPETYTSLLRQDFLPELERAARIADRFYSGRWLGSNVLDRMIQFTAYSASFRELMCGLFAGTQEYQDLKRQTYRRMPRIFAESLASVIHPTPLSS
jgi:geranylgeranyl diphosphate/geranylgeranyl-bacteriochlorophyllide a reductase